MLVVSMGKYWKTRWLGCAGAAAAISRARPITASQSRSLTASGSSILGSALISAQILCGALTPSGTSTGKTGA